MNFWPRKASIDAARPTTEPAADSPLASDLAGLLTHEDADRAKDRWRVSRARWVERRSGVRGKLWVLWLLVGPGVLVFLGENDAPSMLSYSASGAQFGIGFFIPFVVLTFAMGLVVQEMTVRLGAVTHRGHAELIFDRFGRFWGFFSMGDLVLGNFLTLVTEFIGIRAGLGFFGIRPGIAVGAGLLVVFAAITTGRYWTWERITLGLAIFNGLFVPAAILAKPDWPAVGHALLTWTPFPHGNGFDIMVLMLADIGATVTPWMIFFQQSAVVDKGWRRFSPSPRFWPPRRCFITASMPLNFRPRNSRRRWSRGSGTWAQRFSRWEYSRPESWRPSRFPRLRPTRSERCCTRVTA